MSDRLFTVDDQPGGVWTGNTLPVLYRGPVVCGRCHHGHVARLAPYVMEPFMIGAGYGEATEIHATRCPACGDTRVIARMAHRPAIRPASR